MRKRRIKSAIEYADAEKAGYSRGWDAAVKELKGRVYGLDGTIHQTEHVDVEIGPDGHVVSVWFRCSVLPFRETRVDHNRADEMRMTKGYEESMVGVVFRE